MIVELLIGAGLVAAGAAAARVMVRRREADEEEEDLPPTDDLPRNKAKKTAPKDTPRGLRVGDVLLYGDSELWLAGCLELDEEGFVARLFPCPGGGRAEWVLQLDETANDLVTARPTDDVPDGPVPEALPVEGRRLSLEARGAASVSSQGEHLPRTTKRVNYTILTGVGGRVLLVLDFLKGDRLALVGDRVGRHMVDLLPGGDIEES